MGRVSQWRKYPEYTYCGGSHDKLLASEHTTSEVTANKLSTQKT